MAMRRATKKTGSRKASKRAGSSTKTAKTARAARSTKRTGRGAAAARPKARRGAGKQLVQAEDLLLYRFLSDPRLSPDGESVVFTHKQVGPDNRYVINLWLAREGMEPRQLTAGGADSHARWAPDGSQLAFVRGGKDRDPQVFTLTASGGEASPLTRFPEGSIRTFRWSPDGRMLAVAFRETAPDLTKAAKKTREASGASTPPMILETPYYREDGDGYFGAARYALYVVDVTTGDHRKLFDAPLGVGSFDWSPDSRHLAAVANLDKDALHKPWATQIYRIDVRTGKASVIPGLPDGSKDAVIWSPDGTTIAYAGREGREDLYSTKNLHLWTVEASGGKPKNLTKRFDYCMMAACISDSGDPAFAARIEWAPSSKEIYALIGLHGESHIAAITRRGDLRFLTRGAYVHNLGNLSAKGARIALVRGSANKLDEIHIADIEQTARGSRLSGRKAKALDAILNVQAWTDLNGPLLKQRELARLESKWIRAEDGSPLQVWALFPPGVSPRRKLPAVLEIHGGPHAQYGVGYFHEFQMLAAAGHAVFFSNPRGSKGYGEAHCDAIRGSWGQADWVDIQAVMKHMQEHPRVDEKRMGVMGGSYGGYMTNWVIGHTRAFRAAITDRCVSNLVSMSGSSDFPQLPDTYWKGSPWDRPEDLWKGSPIAYLGKCKTPTLIIHSEGDLRCNIEQAEQVHAALMLNKVPVRFVRYPKETSHGMSRSGPPDLRIHRLHEILSWWGKWLG